MGTEDHDRVAEFFLKARELDSERRRKFLDEACAGDAQLRAEVESLLEYDQTTETRTAEPAEPLASPPATIGHYRILQKIGAGGMGVVYEAEQPHPRRKVALKVIRGGSFIDDAALRSFQREADTLARLKHPNIAAIYESGRTEDGQHFFAMELVRGETLNAYLHKRPKRLTPEELRHRLGLFRQITEAVHYAHQRGVIHRDLKPSNIIVTEETTSEDLSVSGVRLPSVKVLDFGLARITEGDMAATMTTEVGVIKGTLPYMSPEQARGRPEAIDVRADVYALGVILYEMLAGRRPYELGRGSVPEALRVICEVAPHPLGETWSGVKRLDPDIETIVGKALEKDADRRYASAAALAEDVSRYLTSQPILARPPSTIYQLRKFARRNRALVGGVVATFVVLVAGIVISTSFGLREAVQRRRAEANNIFALGRNLIEENPSAALAHAIASLELADNPAVRDFAMEVISNGPTAFSENVGDGTLRMKFSRDGNWLAAGGYRGLHKVWNVDGSPSRTLSGHGDDVFVNVRFSNDARFHVSGDDNDVRVWTLPELSQVRQFDPDGHLLSLRSAMVGVGEKLFHMEPLGGEKYRLSWLPIMDGEVEELGVWQGTASLRFDPWCRRGVDRDGEWFAYTAGTGLFVLPLEELESATPRRVGFSDDELYFFKFHPDGKQVVTVDAGVDGASRASYLIQFWSFPDGSAKPLRSIQAHEAWGQFLGFDDGDRWLATIDNWDQGVSVWDLLAPPGTQPLVLRRSEEIVASLDVHPAGTWVAAGDMSTVSIWPLGGSHTRVLLRQEGQNNGFSGVVFDPDGEWFVSSSPNGEIRFWPLSPDGGEPGRILWDDWANGLIGALSVAPNGEYIVADRWFGGKVMVLPVSGGEPRWLAGFRGVNATAIDADSRRVAAAGGERYVEDAHVRIWDLESGEEQVLDAGDNKFIWGLEFTAGGRLLSSGEFGLRLWNPDTGEFELLLEGAAYGTLSPDGRSCFGVRTVDPEDPQGPGIAFVLDLEHRVIRDLPWSDLWIRGTTRLGTGLRSLAWHPSGEKVVFQDRVGTIQVASIGDDPPYRLVGHKGASVLAIHPDGQWIASGGADGTLRLWPMPEGQPLHTLPMEEFLGKLRSLTNYRVVADEESLTGYRIEFGRLPSWDEVPTW